MDYSQNIRQVSPRDIRWDVMKLCAITCVVAIHTIAAPNLHSANSSVAFLSQLINACSRWAVPAFVMVSTVTLMDKTTDVSCFYLHRFRRLFVPMVCWSIFYMSARVLREGISWSTLIDDSIMGRPYYHLWFVYMLVPLYIFMPFIVSFSKIVTPIVVLGLGVFIVLSTSLFGGWIWGVAPYIGYGMISIIVYKIAERILTWGHTKIVLAMFGLLVYVVATILIVIQFRRTDDLVWFNYYNGHVLIQSVAIFVVFCLIQSYFLNRASLWIKNMADLTFGVYLVHPLVKGLVKLLKLDCIWINDVSHVVINFVLVLALSFLLTYVLSRVKVAKLSVGF